jgi:uncharacterized membrane protein YphA (DoxX/SURF4 family)
MCPVGGPFARLNGIRSAAGYCGGEGEGVIRGAISEDVSELLFRLLFSSIFLVLGAEHLFDDRLIQGLIPDWVPLKRFASAGAGILLIVCGASIALGVRVYWAAIALSAFLIAVTAIVHIPGMFSAPSELSDDWKWLWDVYQRSNFIKNVCLLGVCFHFFYHEPGKYSLEARWRS